MTGYTKLFGSIIASTIWRESKETKIVWITMLAMAKKDGIVEASVPGLAVLAGVTVPECESAISTLSNPDPYSRSKEHEGRRIAESDGGWLILNHAKYREKMGSDERREYLRVKQHEQRQKRKRQQEHQQSSTESTHAEAEAKADTDTEIKKKYCFLLKESIRTPRITDLWLKWIDHRKKFRSKDWWTLFSGHAEFLNRYDELNAFHILDISLRNGWQGLFEPKNYANNGPTGAKGFDRSKGTFNEGRADLYKPKPYNPDAV